MDVANESGLPLFAYIIDIEWTRGLVCDGWTSVNQAELQSVLEGLSIVAGTLTHQQASEGQSVSIIQLSTDYAVRYVSSSLGGNNSIRILQCGFGYEVFSEAPESVKIEIGVVGEWECALQCADGMLAHSGWAAFIGGFDTQSYLVS